MIWPIPMESLPLPEKIVSYHDKPQLFLFEVCMGKKSPLDWGKTTYSIKCNFVWRPSM